MFLSAAECSIVGRIAAGWPIKVRDTEPLRERWPESLSLLRVLEGVFDEFGLERCRPLVWQTLTKLRTKEEGTLDAFQRAVQVLRSPESHEAALADHLVAAFYRDAERELLDFPDEFNDLVLVTMVIMLAHGRACRASMYLYGKLHGATE